MNSSEQSVDECQWEKKRGRGRKTCHSQPLQMLWSACVKKLVTSACKNIHTVTRGSDRIDDSIRGNRGLPLNVHKDQSIRSINRPIHAPSSEAGKKQRWLHNLPQKVDLSLLIHFQGLDFLIKCSLMGCTHTLSLSPSLLLSLPRFYFLFLPHSQAADTNCPSNRECSLINQSTLKRRLSLPLFSVITVSPVAQHHCHHDTSLDITCYTFTRDRSFSKYLRRRRRPCITFSPAVQVLMI